MKIISMYLPQFHRVAENDAWWGEGFTDWVATRNAQKLVKDHYQPHIPLNKNYYDLMDKNVMKWQAELMHEYGIDGQCIYHYWFKDGRKILEKPAENLLKWTDIEMPFCFCWANETWARSWSKIKKANAWSDIEEMKHIEGDNGILLEQNYGGEKDWIQHFEYLLPFFKDARYIKKDGKPVFMIYRSSDVYCLEEMIMCFNKQALTNDLPGIYFICVSASDELPDNVDAILIHEPLNSIHKIAYTLENNVRMLNYEQCWDYSLQYVASAQKAYYGGFVGYDDTPRRGVKGMIISGSTPETFTKNLAKLLAKNEALGNEYVFINAWNEWGEGMHLEPDEKWGYQYLEGIKRAKREYKEITYPIDVRDVSDEVKKLKNQSDKFERYLNILDQWMSLREKNVSLVSFFLEKKYTRVAIYGYGIYARHLIEELRYSDVEIVVLIDKRWDKIQCEIEMVSPGNEPDGIDAIIVTSFFYFKEIKKFYAESSNTVLSIENIIKEVECNYGK